MRIRWTTRIATAAGLLTLIAGIATGGGAAHAAARPAAASAVATTSSVTIGLSWTHRGA
jgi:Zn-dependent alcohol dehydrogenase